MSNKRLGFMSVLLLLVVGLAVTASALDIQITKTEINDVEVLPDSYVSLDLEKGGELEVSVEFVSNDDLEDVEVRATILSSEDDIEEILPLFDTRADTEYRKTVRLNIPESVDEDEYRLLLIISDRRDGEITESFNIYLNSQRHLVAIEDVMLHPFGRVTAGEYVLAKVRLENFGQKDEDNIRVLVSVPELDVQALSYVNELEFDDQEDTEEMLLPIPECAAQGQYEMQVVVQYNDGRDTVTDQRSLFVRDNPDCTKKETTDTPAVVVVKGEPTAKDTAPAVDTESEGGVSARRVLEIALLVLVVLLVIVGLIIGFMKLKGSED